MEFFDSVKEGASKSLNWGLDKIGFEGGVVGGAGPLLLISLTLIFLIIFIWLAFKKKNNFGTYIIAIFIVVYLIGGFAFWGFGVNSNWGLCPRGNNYIFDQTRVESFSINKPIYWMGTNLYGCGRELGPRELFNHQFLSFLGFKQTPEDFIGDFLLGLFAGFILWLIYTFAYSSERFNSWLSRQVGGEIPGGSSLKLRSSWLNFIASSHWKAVVIGLFYATLLQIPFIMTFMNIITFKVLGTPPWARAVIVAFYFGLLPAGYEAYRRYKLRNKYYEKVLEIKSGASSLRELTRS
jgi:hypothetical protein